MTITAQHRSLAVVSDTQKSITKAKNDIQDNNRLILSVFDSLNSLCEKLSRLEFVLRRKGKGIEQILYLKGRGEAK
jgi:hypothetical protein